MKLMILASTLLQICLPNMLVCEAMIDVNAAVVAETHLLRSVKITRPLLRHIRLALLEYDIEAPFYGSNRIFCLDVFPGLLDSVILDNRSAIPGYEGKCGPYSTSRMQLNPNVAGGGQLCLLQLV